MDTPTIVWSIVVIVILGCLVVLTVKWYRYGTMMTTWRRKKKHSPESTPVSRDLAQEELARLREIGGNGQHKRAS